MVAFCCVNPSFSFSHLVVVVNLTFTIYTQKGVARSQHHVISKIPQGKVMEKSDNFVPMKLLSKPETKVSSVYTWTGDTAEGVKIFAYKK